MPVAHRKLIMWHIYFSQSETEQIRDDAKGLANIMADAIKHTDLAGMSSFTSALVRISGYGLRIHAGNCLKRGNRLKLLCSPLPPWVIPSEYIPGSEEYGIRTPY